MQASLPLTCLACARAPHEPGSRTWSGDPSRRGPVVAGGGGTLISFPALLILGFPAITANVTSTLGLLPGYAGGSLAYRAELSTQRARIRFLGPVSVIGAVVGAILLTRTSNNVFTAVVPWLILVACALLLLQPIVTSRVTSRRPEHEQHRSPVLAVTQFLGGIYGAFFSAGLGVMMLAVLGLFIRDDLQRINALKGMMSLIINVVAAVYFAFFVPVSWIAAAVMLPTSSAGGFAGVALARRLSPAVLRTIVIAFGVAFAIHLLVQG